jgi:hypothetical protein
MITHSCDDVVRKHGELTERGSLSRTRGESAVSSIFDVYDQESLWLRDIWHDGVHWTSLCWMSAAATALWLGIIGLVELAL